MITPQILYGVTCDRCGETLINSNDNSAPTVALALQWVRNKHYLAADVFPTASGWAWCISKAPNGDQPGGTTIKELAWDGPNEGGAFDTYEEAELSVLSEMLNLIGISKLVER